MNPPKVSVIIPAYNQAEFLGEAIQSVLDQTYSNFEVIIVNDASADHTSDVVMQFNDPRVKLIVHEKNKGLPATRNTGIRASNGEFIALLDADDIFHPEKLEVHLDFMDKHPNIGVSYNARYNLNHSAKTIRDLWRPPLSVNLLDFVLGFPFTPSDMVVRRRWAFRVGLFDESFVCGGEDSDFPCRLALAGCQFASVDRALNYRRYHSGRHRKNLPCRLNDVVRVLNNTFKDPRCPKDVLAVRGLAIKHHLMVLVSLAFSQGEIDLGRKYLSDLIGVDPSILEGFPCGLIEFILFESIADENKDHRDLLWRILKQFPEELAWLSNHYDWAVARGYLIRGMREVIWGRLKDGYDHFSQAAKLGAEVDEQLIQYVTTHIINYENEFGTAVTRDVLRNLSPCINMVGGRTAMCSLIGSYYINRAFTNYKTGKFIQVPGDVLRAIFNEPVYLTNRGVLTIMFRSIFTAIRQETLLRIGELA
jgi:glycosyltransferase involved in cell wall biosynthesis